ncbi:RDD family protein [Streptomyces aureocirculatus]|uniref:RDD family protein n=1 Tax=Streptomyces aureocirculatus TaxID=67275 RepID=UPI0004C47C42|nr:RDD family protein [Streptomyces aureocirculatus]
MSNPYGPPPQQPGQPEQAGQPGYGYPQQAPQGVPPQQGGYPGQHYPSYPQQQGGQSPYGAPQQGYDPNGYGAARPELAHWGLRVGAFAVDMLVFVGIYIVMVVGLVIDVAAVRAVIVVLGVAALIGMVIYQLIQEGRTGQTIGKKAVGIRLLRELDGRPVGVGMAFVRRLAHFLDSLPFYIGWLWPLWDSKKQTFADKVCSTVVIKG